MELVPTEAGAIFGSNEDLQIMIFQELYNVVGWQSNEFCHDIGEAIS